MDSSPVQQIKDRLDVVEVIGSYIKLKKTGANFSALCPFHSEKKPSFFVSPARQIWHCFGCSIGGGLFDFVMKIEGVEFGDALRILAQKAGVELKRQDPKLRTERNRFYDICEISCRFFEKQLEGNLTGKEAKEYLLKRGITSESIEKWRVGYSPDSWQGLSDFLVSRDYTREEIIKAGLAIRREESSNLQSPISNFQSYDRFRSRIIFPIFDLNSQVIGFGGRVFGDAKRPDGQEEVKYINTPNTLLYDKSQVLYGLDKAKIAIRKKDGCILVEGYTDVILCHQAGFENTVATSGTALSPYQLKTLKRYSENLLTAFDMDVAGDTATKKGIDLALSQGFNVKVISLPEDSDPADVISQNPSAWEKSVETGKSILDFYFESAFSNLDSKTPEGRKEISKVLLPVIKKIPSNIEQSFWVQKLAKNLQVRESAVVEDLRKAKMPEIERKKESSSASLPPKARKELLEEHLISLVLKSADFLNRLKKEDFDFFSPFAVQILTNLNSLYLGKKDLSQNQGIWLSKEDLELFPQLSNVLNYLSLMAEIEEEEDIEKEFGNCLREIKSLIIKNKLDIISKNIKIAEEQNNSAETQKLLEEFNHHSKSLYNLDGEA